MAGPPPKAAHAALGSPAAGAPAAAVEAAGTKLTTQTVAGKENVEEAAAYDEMEEL